MEGDFVQCGQTTPFPPRHGGTGREGERPFSTAKGVSQQVVPGFDEHILVRTGAGQMHHEAANAHLDSRTDLEQVKADRLTGGVGHSSPFQPHASQG